MKKRYRKVAAWAMTLLGVTSMTGCDEMRVEYGCPYMTFSARGTVTDESGNPVKGVEVRNEEGSESNVANTDAEGRFIFDSDAVMPTDSITMRFTDADGEANGGEFAEKRVRVAVKKVADGESTWDEGRFAAEDINVKLEKK